MNVVVDGVDVAELCRGGVVEGAGVALSCVATNMLFVVDDEAPAPEYRRWSRGSHGCRRVLESMICWAAWSGDR